MSAAASELAALAHGAPVGRVMVIVAHPDDETLWAGAALADRDEVSLVHLTDGAPRDPFFARAAGVDGREALAALRARELECALRVLGIEGAHRVSLGAPDQEAARYLVRLVDAVARAIEERVPALVLAHAYDGGHPDHDCAAFVARAALARTGSQARLVDLQGYRDEAGTQRVGFLPREGAWVFERALEGESLARKRAALACFASQRDVLARLEENVERFRAGVREDFGAPPHRRPLHYERHGWPIDYARWSAEIRDAARALELPTVLP